MFDLPPREGICGICIPIPLMGGIPMLMPPGPPPMVEVMVEELLLELE